MNQEPFRQFAEDLITKSGTITFPADFTAELRDRLTLEIEQRIGFMALDHLDEKAADEFTILMSGQELPTPDEWQGFFQKNIPDFKDKVVEVLHEVAQEFNRDNKITA